MVGSAHRPARVTGVGLAAALAFALAFAVAACGSSNGTPPAGGSASAALPAASDGTPVDTGASSAPSEAAPTEASAVPPSEAAPSVQPGESPGAGAAAACTGTDDNKLFFANAATAVDWNVLCGVLPSGWFVAKGVYRANGGGRVLVSYSGPNGTAASISQGAWCKEADGCVPDGTEVGPAKLGPMDGTLIKIDDKDYVVVVGRGEPVSWMFEAVGMGQKKAVALAAAAAVVAD